MHLTDSVHAGDLHCSGQSKPSMANHNVVWHGLVAIRVMSGKG